MEHRYLSGSFCDVSVLDTSNGSTYFYRMVPIEHAKMLRTNTNLKVRFLKFYRGRPQTYKVGETYERPEKQNWGASP